MTSPGPSELSDGEDGLFLSYMARIGCCMMTQLYCMIGPGYYYYLLHDGIGLSAHLEDGVTALHDGTADF